MTQRAPAQHDPIKPAQHLRLRLIACPLVAFVLLGGCAVTDPFDRPGVWNAGHVNDDNLRAMVAVPSDLVRGTGDGRSDGSLAEAALMRQRLDKVRKLPDTAIADVTPTSSGDTASQGGN